MDGEPATAREPDDAENTAAASTGARSPAHEAAEDAAADEEPGGAELDRLRRKHVEACAVLEKALGRLNADEDDVSTLRQQLDLMREQISTDIESAASLVRERARAASQNVAGLHGPLSHAPSALSASSSSPSPSTETPEPFRSPVRNTRPSAARRPTTGLLSAYRSPASEASSISSTSRSPARRSATLMRSPMGAPGRSSMSPHWSPHMRRPSFESALRHVEPPAAVSRRSSVSSSASQQRRVQASRPFSAAQARPQHPQKVGWDDDRERSHSFTGPSRHRRGAGAGGRGFDGGRGPSLEDMFDRPDIARSEAPPQEVSRGHRRTDSAPRRDRSMDYDDEDPRSRERFASRELHPRRRGSSARYDQYDGVYDGQRERPFSQGGRRAQDFRAQDSRHNSQLYPRQADTADDSADSDEEFLNNRRGRRASMRSDGGNYDDGVERYEDSEAGRDGRINGRDADELVDPETFAGLDDYDGQSLMSSPHREQGLKLALQSLHEELRWVDENAIQARIESERRLMKLVEALASRVASLESEKRELQAKYREAQAVLNPELEERLRGLEDAAEEAQREAPRLADLLDATQQEIAQMGESVRQSRSEHREQDAFARQDSEQHRQDDLALHGIEMEILERLASQRAETVQQNCAANLRRAMHDMDVGRKIDNASLDNRLRDALARLDLLEQRITDDHEQSVQMLELLLQEKRPRGAASAAGSSASLSSADVGPRRRQHRRPADR